MFDRSTILRDAHAQTRKMRTWARMVAILSAADALESAARRSASAFHA